MARRMLERRPNKRKKKIVKKRVNTQARETSTSARRSRRPLSSDIFRYYMGQNVLKRC